MTRKGQQGGASAYVFLQVSCLLIHKDCQDPWTRDLCSVQVRDSLTWQLSAELSVQKAPDLLESEHYRHVQGTQCSLQRPSDGQPASQPCISHFSLLAKCPAFSVIWGLLCVMSRLHQSQLILPPRLAGCSPRSLSGRDWDPG